MLPQLGVVIEQAVWLGPHSVRVSFESSHTDYFHQAYVGRRLSAVSGSPADRSLIVQLDPSHATPPPLQIVAVPAHLRSVHHGAKLPDRPYNLHSLNWSAAGFPADTARFDVAGSDTEGGAPNASNVIGSTEWFSGLDDYSLELPALASSGDWKFGVTAYDDAQPNGNASDLVEHTIEASVYPPDLEHSSGDRFGLAISQAVATISFSHRVA